MAIPSSLQPALTRASLLIILHFISFTKQDLTIITMLLSIYRPPAHCPIPAYKIIKTLWPELSAVYHETVQTAISEPPTPRWNDSVTYHTFIPSSPVATFTPMLQPDVVDVLGLSSSILLPLFARE